MRRMRYIIGGVERPGRGWYLTLLAALAVLALAGLSVGRMLRLPFDGTDWAPDAWRPEGLLITPSQPASGGLQPGDVVTVVDGTPLETWARALLQPAFPRPHWQAGQVVTYTVTRNGVSSDVPVPLVRFPVGRAFKQHWGHVLTLLAFQIVGTFVFVRRPDDGAARVFFLAACCGFAATANWLFGLHVVDIVDGLRFWLYRVTGQGTGLLFLAALLHFTLIFPRPLPILHKRRYFVPMLYGLPYTLYVGTIAVAYFRSETTLVWLGTWTAGARPVFLAYTLLTAAAILAQYRSGSSTIVRRKIRWVMLAVWVSVGGYFFLYLLPVLVTGRPVIGARAQGIIALPIPLALMIAIWRYQLFDIDTLLNRAMVYGALTACVVAIYVLVMGYLGTLLEVRAQHVASLIAAGIIAVLLQPLRERLQRAVNRWMFGQRDEPYHVLAGLGQRLEAAFEPSAILPTLVQTVRESLKLPYVAITLAQNGSTEIAAASGAPSAEPVPFPLVYQGTTIGQLLVGPRRDEAMLSAADRRLLADLAQQAGAAVHGVCLMADLQRLTADLQQSRERLVLAREEERRRMRRDLHDDLAPTLAGLSLTAETISELIPTDPDKASALACDLHTAIRETVGNIRRLVYDLRPPALDQFGLLAAIRERAAQYDGYRDGSRVLHVTLEAPAVLQPLPAAVEVAAYRIVQEALMNVVRHAQAEHCHIRLAVGNALTLDVTDDGVGLADTDSVGVGLRSMRERAAELGGTCGVTRSPDGETRISVCLPIVKEETHEPDSSPDR
jgi:two-component system NarL family sensor kinase